MGNSEKDQKIVEQLKKLGEKYEAMGQDISSYLDGLLYADYLTYWDYIHLDTLLSLQTPRTGLPDEKIFIIYHQITELYFQLVRNEMHQISFEDCVDIALFKTRIRRILMYWQHLVSSFDVMVEGMDPSQFLKFRMALLPASGFQSAQYRMIEIGSTPLENLIDAELRKQLSESLPTSDLIGYLYWRRGATELASDKKTLTLRQFEAKYLPDFVSMGKEMRGRTIWEVYQNNYSGTGDEGLIDSLKLLDHTANVLWPLAHLRSAGRYLHKEPQVIAATGGTNWQKYLPPRFQMISFFPGLWSEEEKQQWGRAASLQIGQSE